MDEINNGILLTIGIVGATGIWIIAILLAIISDKLDKIEGKLK